MSALAIEVSDVRFPMDVVTQQVADTPAVNGSTHPRGRGFGVLSRIARGQQTDEDYIPRHRSDSPVACLASV